MYLNYINNEVKKWLRDPMMKFMVFYPLIFGILGKFIVPVIAEQSGFSVENYADLIIVILVLMTPMIYGALTGFSILDDRDDNILESIKVTPLSIHQFLLFKLAVTLGLSWLAGIFVMWFSDIGDISIGNIIIISLLAALSAPASGLLINALSKNKIEGFAIMKGTGIVIVFPIAALFFMDSKELLFSFAPGFWPAKTISSLVRVDALLMTFNQYYFIGLLYVIILNVLMYRLFIKKARV